MSNEGEVIFARYIRVDGSFHWVILRPFLNGAPPLSHHLLVSDLVTLFCESCKKCAPWTCTLLPRKPKGITLLWFMWVTRQPLWLPLIRTPEYTPGVISFLLYEQILRHKSHRFKSSAGPQKAGTWNALMKHFQGTTNELKGWEKQNISAAIHKAMAPHQTEHPLKKWYIC